MVEYRHRTDEGKDIRTQLEVDFIAKSGDTQIYVQSALNVDTPEKRLQEINSMIRTNKNATRVLLMADDKL